MIGQDTTILPGTILKEKQSLGKTASSARATVIEDALWATDAHQRLPDRAVGWTKESKSAPLPVRPNSHLKAGVKIGNFGVKIL
ncbi:MAG: hypothetical protein ACLRXC_10540 [[Clostridium] leptum]